MLYLLLGIIAVGVLLCSEEGKSCLGCLLSIAIVLFIIFVLLILSANKRESSEYRHINELYQNKSTPSISKVNHSEIRNKSQLNYGNQYTPQEVICSDSWVLEYASSTTYSHDDLPHNESTIASNILVLDPANIFSSNNASSAPSFNTALRTTTSSMKNTNNPTMAENRKITKKFFISGQNEGIEGRINIPFNNSSEFISNKGNVYFQNQNETNIKRSIFWKDKGFDFNPDLMNSYMMDQKVNDIQRAKQWKEKGYDFNPNFMNAYMMDQKVRDIQRAQYWKEKGYDFNPNFMNVYMMDQKVKDIERARYWKEH